MSEKHKNLHLDDDFIWIEEKNIGSKKSIKIPLEKVDSFEHGGYTLWALILIGILFLGPGIYFKIAILVIIGIILIFLGFLIRPEQIRIKSQTNTITQYGKGGEVFLEKLEKNIRKK